MTALEDLTTLVSSLPNSSLLTDAMKQSALNGAVVPDVNSVWPGQPDYVATYDVYWAACSLLMFLMAQPVIRQTSSEGTSVAVDAPSWSGLMMYYRSMSQIANATGNGVLGVIEIPDTPHVYHTNMSEGSDGNDNVDTDLD